MTTKDQRGSDKNPTDDQEITPTELKRLRYSYQKAEQATWNEEFKTALLVDYGDDKGRALFTAYKSILSPGYRRKYDPLTASKDIKSIGKVLDGERLSVSILRKRSDRGESIHLRAFNKGKPIRLTDIFPVFEKFGVEVIENEVLPLTPVGSAVDELWLNDFTLLNQSVSSLDDKSIEEKFLDAFTRVWAGELENGRFNGLVINAGVSWREVQIFRAYAHYLHQIGMPFTPLYVAETLLRNSDTVLELLTLFSLLFDPVNDGLKNREHRVELLHKRIDSQLDRISNADDDRILRRFLNLINSTLRTNYYQSDSAGNSKPYISFKLNSGSIDSLPLPRPWREIFVYSPRMEGIHLRGGAVARGGLRWSDRMEDFRTEILGLVKAQMVKNSVIIPVGSKGGFVCKLLHKLESRESQFEEVKACYKSFIRGLLDITDNLIDSEVVHPAAVIRRDEDDPYLVVAADKGTATFSDIANEVAAEYGYWLGDAFASGGSYGYDHKAIGITARGAWESVRHHFHQRDHNIDVRNFTVAGIGDMSGDVFGNGMLLSRKICLLAAFNHKHIFIDPTPDPEISFDERERLFYKAKGWDSYNSKLISSGGGVFNRSAKSILVSPQMKRLFGLEANRVSPNELISNVLKAEVDLIWFGGIGTYVRAASESDHLVGDCTNDSVRVVASELQCKVIGEGANLGITQLGRIEYGLNGGSCNADFIDNSGGVDCSDHEVNIKILLGGLISCSCLTVEQRNRLLEEMEPEITEDILRDNYLQSQAISFAESFGIEGFDRYVRLVKRLEKSGRLNRQVEYLPTDDILSERRKIGAGLTRPEIAVMMCHGKNWLFDEVIAGDLPDEAGLEEYLIGYFPKRLQTDYANEILRHTLRREIISTSVVNAIANRLGATFVAYLTERTARSADEIVAAFIVVRKSFDLDQLWGEIDNLSVTAGCAKQNELRRLVSRFSHVAVEWVLDVSPGGISINELSETLTTGAQYINSNFEEMVQSDILEAYLKEAARLRDKSIPVEVAERVASLPVLVAAGDIAFISKGRSVSMECAAQAYFGVGDLFTLDSIRHAARGISPETPWHLRAVSSLNEQLYACQRSLAEVVLNRYKGVSASELHRIDDLNRIKVRAEELVAETDFIAKRVFDFVMQNGTSKSPFCTQSSTAY
ncbi:MAG: NAD-glutamate dehydrogenase [Candidatus Sedimenticola sp. (ex Thyasira tokunagai)]